MKSDKREYIRLCAFFNVKVESMLVNALSTSSATGSLHLSGVSLSNCSCQILGKVIATSITLKKLDVSNCILTVLGTTHILHGLSCNSSITDVDLSSNNLHSDIAIQIGTLLQKSVTLKRLFLQWNSLGNSCNAFRLFCESLGANQSLEELDLRNNQLGPSCTQDLIASLRSNKCLHNLDVRWNSLGPGNGRDLLATIKSNANLVCIQLDGNNFNADLILAIEQAAIHNGDILQLAQEWQARCSRLVRYTKQLEQREGQRSSGVRFLLQHQGQAMDTICREQKDEVKKSEAQLCTAKEKINMLESLIKYKDAQIVTLQEMHQEIQYGRNKESEDVQNELVETKKQLEAARLVLQQLQDHIKAKDIEILELRGAKDDLKDKLSLHNLKCSDVIKAAEERALAAVQQAKQERACAEERLLRDRSQLQVQLSTLERTKLELEAKVSAERDIQSEALVMAKRQAAQHEAERASMLEAKISALITEKDALVSKIETSEDHATQLKQEIDNIKKELSKQQKINTELQEVLLQERNRFQELQAKFLEGVSKQEEVTQFSAQLMEVQAQLNTLNDEKEAQVRQLTKLVASQEQHLSALRLNEAERAGLLCTAITQYLTKIGTAVNSTS